MATEIEIKFPLRDRGELVRKLNDLVLHQVYAAVERYEYRDSWL